MVKPIKLRRAGGSLTATLPKDVVERLQVEAGDTLYAVDTKDGLLLTPFDPTFEAALSLYREGARAYRNTLRELAK